MKTFASLDFAVIAPKGLRPSALWGMILEPFEQFAVNLRNQFRIDLWSALVSQQSIHFLFDVG
jgi:hypothetical protein